MQTRQRTTRYPNTQLNLKNNIHIRVAMVCCRYMHMHIQWSASLVPRFYKCLGMRLVESHLSYPNCQNNDIANTFPSSQLLFIYTCTFKHRMRFHACIILESTCTYMYLAVNVCVLPSVMQPCALSMGERESCLRPDSCEVEVDLEPSASEIETSVHMITQKSRT